MDELDFFEVGNAGICHAKLENRLDNNLEFFTNGSSLGFVFAVSAPIKIDFLLIETS